MNGIYKNITAVCHYFMPFFLKIRLYKNKENKRSISEKMGFYQHKNHVLDQKFIIRIHGASVGEVISALSVIQQLNCHHNDIFFVLTSSSLASAEYLHGRLPANCVHVFAPIDTPQIVKHFYKHYKPNLEIIIDSEIWPNALNHNKKNAIPVIGLNTRLSEKSMKFWGYLSKFLKSTLSAYHAFYVQNQRTADFLSAYYNGYILVAENLKWIISPPPYHQHEYEQLEKNLCQKFVVSLYSTHEAEEINIITKCLEYGFFQNDHHVMIIAPRHIVRSDTLFEQIKKIIPSNFISRRSANEPITEATKIYFADTMGDVALIAKLSDVLFMGNSLSVKGGGHNPIEPASIGTGIITGDKLQNFTEIYDIFRSENSCIFSESTDDLIRKIIILKNNSYLLSQITEKSYNLCQKYRESALLPISQISQFIHHLKS